MRARTPRVFVGGLLCLTATLAVTAGVVFARAPVLESVNVCSGQATVNWSLPQSVESRLVETATADTTNVFGYFYPQGSIYSFDIPRNLQTDTSVVVDDPLNGKFLPGTYYAHVGGVDTTRQGSTVIEFSNIVPFVVDASGNGGGSGSGTASHCPSGGGGGNGGSGGRTVNKVTPFGRLSYTRIQSIGKLFVTVHTTEAGTLRAAGSVSVPGAAKTYRFRPASRKVGAFASVKLRLRLSKKNLVAVKRALKKKGAHLKAKITVTATNSAGIARSQKATIKLKA